MMVLGDAFTSLLVVWFAIAFYLLPSIIALDRKPPNTWSVVVINVLLGWTLIGWVAALAMAVRSKPAPTPATPTVPAIPTAEPAEGLSRLADLHAQGLITDDEFSAAKSRLLAD